MILAEQVNLTCAYEYMDTELTVVLTIDSEGGEMVLAASGEDVSKSRRFSDTLSRTFCTCKRGAISRTMK